MKNVDHILNVAKQIITEELKKAGYDSEAIYLFGSRARGDFNKDSRSRMKIQNLFKKEVCR